MPLWAEEREWGRNSRELWIVSGFRAFRVNNHILLAYKHFFLAFIMSEKNKLRGEKWQGYGWKKRKKSETRLERKWWVYLVDRSTGPRHAATRSPSAPRCLLWFRPLADVDFVLLLYDATIHEVETNKGKNNRLKKNSYTGTRGHTKLRYFRIKNSRGWKENSNCPHRTRAVRTRLLKTKHEFNSSPYFDFFIFFPFSFAPRIFKILLLVYHWK